jgi:hypothetical protein
MRRYLKYKGVTVGAFGLPVLFSSKKNTQEPGEPERKYFQYQCFIHNFKNTAPRDLIVMYDIPTEKKKEREWFRRHLQKFGYIMIQKSVWVGPSPLPRDFLNYLKKLGLLSQLRTLKLAKPYSRNDRNM